MQYEVAMWDNETRSASAVRFGSPRSENDAAKHAVQLSNEMQCDMCVIQLSQNWRQPQPVETVVQVVRYCGIARK